MSMTKDELEAIFNQYHKDVFSIAFFYTSSKEDSEDIMVDVFYELMKKPPKHTKGIKSYLLTSAMHKSMNYLNRRNYLKTIEFNEDIKGEKETLYENELAKYIKELSPKIRMVIIYYYFLDLKINEISKLLHVNTNTIKKRLERGRRIIKEKLNYERN